MTDFDDVSTEAAVKTFESATGVFSAILREVRELSKKKPDATLSAGKVKLINNVLSDLLTILQSEPEGKYLQALEDEDLPQVSDALMMMVQFNAASDAFRARYFQFVRPPYASGKHFWITEEQVAAWEAEEAELAAEDEEDGE